MLERARRVALAYRAALVGLNPEVAHQVDNWAIQYGQSWVHPAEWPYADDELLTAQQVADLCHVEKSTVHRWHQRGLPYTATAKGPRIRVADLVEFERRRRQARKS